MGSTAYRDLALLEAYKDGAIIKEEDKEDLDVLRSVGLIRGGYDLDLMVPMARTTELGRRFLGL